MGEDRGIYTVRVTWTMPDGSSCVDYDSIIAKDLADLKKQAVNAVQFLSRGCIEGSCKYTYKLDRHIPVSTDKDSSNDSNKDSGSAFDYLE